jgi:hypothetical protein
MATVTAPAWDTGYEVKEATLANRALARIGVDLIRDTDEATPAARNARAAFGSTRDEILRDYEFNFARQFIELSEDSTFTLKGPWRYAYNASTLGLKILEVDGSIETLYETVLSGAARRLLTNTISTVGSPNKLTVKHVLQMLDPDTWDPLFTDAFVLRLASKIAFALTKEEGLVQQMQAEFAAIAAMAKLASSQERQVDAGEALWTDRGLGDDLEHWR